MTDRYDAVTSRKDKNGKWRSTRIGSAFPMKEGKDGFNIVLDALPMPNAEGQAWVTLWPAKAKDATTDTPAQSNEMNDDIPF